jgi:hypothetical protein
MMNVYGSVEMDAAQIASGVADAKQWLIATTKLAGLQKKAVFDSYVRSDIAHGASNITTIGCENHVRIEKFKAMARRAVKGFKASKDWTCVRDEYDRWAFVSSDEQWRVFIQDSYNGSGGWKVATLTIGIQIKHTSV